MSKFTASNGAEITTNDYGTFKTLLSKTVDNSVSLAGVHVDALREFFQYETDHKPWYDPKAGEVWVLTLDGVESAFYPSKSMSGYFTPVAPETGRTAVAFDSFEIESARRIWPVSDD